MISQAFLAVWLAFLGMPAHLTPEHTCSACQRWRMTSTVWNRLAEDTACTVLYKDVGAYWDEGGTPQKDEPVYQCVTIRRCSRGHLLMDYRQARYVWPMFAERLARPEFERRYGPVQAR